MYKTARRCLVACGLTFYRWILGYFADFLFDVFYTLSQKAVRTPPIREPLLLLSASELAQKIRSREVTSRNVLEAYFRRIDEVQPVINAVVDQRREEALQDADQVEHLLESKTEEEIKREFPLLGVPISVKLIIGVKGMCFSGGHWRRRDVKAERDAEMIRRLRAAGAIPIVNTNTSELGLWPESTNKLHGRTRNPHDTRRSTSASSGGECALLGCAGSVLGIGNDIAGSVRTPAAYCGVFGHKPTNGILSNDGSIPEIEPQIEKFLTPGVMGRYAEDLPLSLKVMLGDKKDLLQLDKEVSIKDLKVFYLEDIESNFIFPSKQEVKESVRKVVSHLRSLCATPPQEVFIPDLKHGFPASIYAACPRPLGAKSLEYKVLGSDDDLTLWKELFLSLFGLNKSLFFLLVAMLVERYMMPRRRLENPYRDVENRLRKDFGDLLREDCVLVMPTVGDTAPYHHATVLKLQFVTHTVVFNLLGLPATNCPVGKDKRGMPIGVQVVAGLNNDRLTLAVAREIEKQFGGWVQPTYATT